MVDLRCGKDDGDLDNDNVVSGGLSGVKDRGDRGGEEREREEKKLTRHPNCKLIPHNPLLANPTKCSLWSLPLPLLPPIVQIPLQGFHYADSLVQTLSCGLHRTDSIVQIL